MPTHRRMAMVHVWIPITLTAAASQSVRNALQRTPWVELQDFILPTDAFKFPRLSELRPCARCYCRKMLTKA